MMGDVNPSLSELEARRAALLEQLAQVGDFRRGSVSESYRRCGKANCACAGAGHPGHGPRATWTRRGPGGKTVGRMLAPGEVDKVRAEVDAYHRFRDLSDELAEVNEAICEARPAAASGPPGLAGSPSVQAASSIGTGGQKGGSRAGLNRPRTRSGKGSGGGSRPRSSD